ncbi:MAG: T9SS type A sorting domain-containing protein, partial [Bacteroidota bacterium]
PKWVNETSFDSLWAPATWSTMVPPITVKSVGVQFGNTGISGAINEGAVQLRDLRISYPEQSAVSSEGRGDLPDSFELHQNYPNPFNPTTNIAYTAGRAAKISLTVYDVLGRRVALLDDRPVTPGTYTVEFDASRFGSGMYFYVLESEGVRQSRSMVLLK